MPKTMKAVVLHVIGVGKPNEARFETVPLSDSPAAGHARVKISAVALNKRDQWIVINKYFAIADNTIIGSDGVGTLVAVAFGAPDHVSSLLDQRVIVFPSMSWGKLGKVSQEDGFRALGNTPDNGTFAEFVDIPFENVFPAPKELDDIQAAALPLAGLTGWRAVKTRGQVEPGSKVLITGAGSGVSTFAMQFAKALGAKVYTTSSSKAKIDFAVNTLGAEGGVNYKEKDWTVQLAKLAGSSRPDNRTFDVIIDSSGGIEDCLTILKPGGRYVFFGNTAQTDHVLTREVMRNIYYLQLQIIGSTMGSPEEFQEMLDFCTEHQLRPVISRVEPFTAEGWAKQIDEMDKGSQQGKLVLTL